MHAWRGIHLAIEWHSFVGGLVVGDPLDDPLGFADAPFEGVVDPSVRVWDWLKKQINSIMS